MRAERSSTVERSSGELLTQECPMSKEILAIAVFDPRAGKDAECLATIRELTGLLRSMGYSRDTLYRDRRNPRLYVDVRLWSSEEAARQAHQDPRLHAIWQRLDSLCTTKQMYEALEEVRAEPTVPRAPSSTLSPPS